jgi:hypothetical protein
MNTQSDDRRTIMTITLALTGEVRAFGWRDGSSGRFTGDIDGLYQGYRFGADPDERPHVLALPHGELAVTVRQRTNMRLPERPAQNPFAGHDDPIAQLRWHLAHASPGSGGPPPPAGPPETPKRTVEVAVDPARSSGIFAGATGLVEVDAPNYEVAGTMRIETATGDLWLDFLEVGAGAELTGRAVVDSDRSTGAWHGASGALNVRFDLDFPNIAEGTYDGSIDVAAAGVAS